MLKKILSKKVLIVFLILMTTGIFLRMNKLGAQSFFADEFLGINIAKGYSETGEWKFWEFNTNTLSDEVYTRANVYYWQVAKTFDFLPISEESARLVSALWGVIAMLTVFFMTFVITRNWTIALIALFLSAVSISELIYDRKLRMYSMFAPVYLWFSYAVYNFLEYKKFTKKSFLRKLCKRKKEGAEVCVLEKIFQKTGFNWFWFFPALFLGFLSLKVHDLTVNIMPTILIYLLTMGVFILFRKKKFKNRYLISIAFFSLVSFILVVLASSLKTIPVVGYIIDKVIGGLAGVSWVFHWTYLQKITLDYSYILFGIFFIVIGSYLMIKKYGKIGLWTVLSFLVPLLMAIFSWRRNVGDQYIYLTQLFKVMIVACGIYFFSKKISSLLSQDKKVFLITLLTVLLLLINIPFFYSSEGFYQSPKSWEYTNYKEGFKYFLKNRSDDALLISRPLSNYYLNGSNVNILAYNDDNEITATKIFQAQNKYNEIWIIFSKNTNIQGDARRLIEKEFELVETQYTNQKLNIYVWKKKQGSIKIGFITDAHCLAKQDKTTLKWNLKSSCEEPLSYFVNKMDNEFKPDIIVNGGDLVDGADDNSIWDFQEAKKLLGKAVAPTYDVLGNHEVNKFSKEEWLKLTGNERTYYKVDINGFRVIFLDGNFTSTGRATGPDKSAYPGKINEEQFLWLQDTLEDAEDLRKIVFVHQPPIETDYREQSRLFIDAEELRALLSEYDVEVVVSGHIERYCKMNFGTSTDYYVLQGFWKSNKNLKEEFRYKKGAVFSEITIGKEAEVKTYYMDNNGIDYKSFVLNRDNADCLDGSAVITEKVREYLEDDMEELE